MVIGRVVCIPFANGPPRIAYHNGKDSNTLQGIIEYLYIYVPIDIILSSFQTEVALLC